MEQSFIAFLEDSIQKNWDLDALKMCIRDSHYTWILSSLNFGVTVLTGLFAGYIAKDKIEEKKKLKLYFGKMCIRDR